MKRALSWDEVRAARVSRSRLAERAPAEQLVEVVREVCGIQAQATGSAELQLAARVDGITQADVREAIGDRRELVKSWTIRGTLHLHPADELGLWLAARRAVAGEPESDAEIVAAIGAALRGRTLTRRELADAVVARVSSAPYEQLTSGWGYFLDDAALAGELCFGPPRGQHVTFVHPSDWLGPGREWEPADALREVARRYAEAYAPVTYREFREWFSSPAFTPAAARELFAQLDPPEPAPVEPQPSVRLLPEYDAYVMGFRERDAPRPARGARAGRRARQGQVRRAGGHAVPGRRRPRRRDLEPQEERQEDRPDDLPGAQARAHGESGHRRRSGANRSVPRPRAPADGRLVSTHG